MIHPKNPDAAIFKIHPDYQGEMYLKLLDRGHDPEQASENLINKMMKFERISSEMNSKKGMKVPRLRNYDSKELKAIKKNLEYSCDFADIEKTEVDIGANPLDTLLAAESVIERLRNHDKFVDSMAKGVRTYVRRKLILEALHDVVHTPVTPEQIERIESLNFKRAAPKSISKPKKENNILDSLNTDSSDITTNKADVNFLDRDIPIETQSSILANLNDDTDIVDIVDVEDLIGQMDFGDLFNEFK